MTQEASIVAPSESSSLTWSGMMTVGRPCPVCPEAHILLTATSFLGEPIQFKS